MISHFIISAQSIDFTYDSNGQTQTKQISGFQPSLEAYELQLTGCDQNTGSIDLILIDGTGPFDILWSDGQTGNKATDLAEGTYQVSITDSKGCLFDTSFIVPLVPLFTYNAIVTEACPGASNGSIEIIDFSNPTTPDYEWSTGGSGSVLFNIGPGEYMVTITDENGCSRDSTFLLNDVQPYQVLEDFTDNSDGTFDISLNITGATPPYLVSWDHGETGPLLTNTENGMYNYSIIDSNGCEYEGIISESLDISKNNEIHIFPNPTEGILHIQINEQSLRGADIIITNPMGRVVFSDKLIKDAHSKTIDLNLPAGFYTLSFNKSTTSYHYKIQLLN